MLTRLVQEVLESFEEIVREQGANFLETARMSPSITPKIAAIRFIIH